MSHKYPVKEWILNAPEFVELRSNAMIHLHLNEIPYDIPLSVKQQVFNRLERMPWNQYPEWRNKRIHQFVAEHIKVPGEKLAIGKGMTLLLRSLFDLLVNPFSSILMVKPEYEYLQTLIKMNQLEVTEIDFERNFTFPVENILDELKANKFDIVYFSNPNTPSGTVISPSKLSKIIETADCPVILDECYAPFTESNMQLLLDRHPNLILVRSLALEYGIASARLGYVLAQPQIIKGLKKVLSPFMLDIFSEAIITVLLEYKEQLTKRIDRIKQIREFVFKQLKKIDMITTFPSQANFILIQFPFNADEVQKLYLEKNILVKSLSHYSGLEQMIRVTVGDEKSMQTFLQATLAIIKEKMSEFY